MIIFGLIWMLIPLIFVVVFVNMIKKAKNQDEFANYTSKRKNYRSKIPSQTNRLSEAVRREQREMQELEKEHLTTDCKYTYTTQNPNFSFNGLPNDYDDFAALRKKNEAHEKHLQRKIY